MKPNDMSNLHCEDHTGLAVRWNDPQGNRYHAWLGTSDDDRKVWLTDGLWSAKGEGGGCIFKNPPDRTKFHDRAYFRTRYLDASSKRWQPVVERIMHFLTEGGGIAAARLKKRMHEEDQEAIRRANARERVVKEVLEGAAPVMLQALQELATKIAEIAVCLDDGMPVVAAVKIEEAVALVEAGIKAATPPEEDSNE